MGQVTLRGLRKRFGATDVIRGVDLDIADGEFMVFVGPSGCGKTTTLRLIAGLESASEGDILIDGRRCNDVHPAQRGAAMVFQSYALYPHMTVAENMGFSLRMAGVGRAERERQVLQAAQTLRIDRLLQRLPRELSGGQRQRVAIGRAIVRNPRVFLFDEPLSNLDAALRVDMRIELKRMHHEIGTTMVYVTHDQVEAMTLADRIAVFRDGRIEQVGAPMDVYERPANRFVATFMGSPRVNLVERPDAQATAAHQRLWAVLDETGDPGLQSIGLRPEHLRLVPNPAPDDVAAQVVLAEHLGDTTIVHLRVEGVDELLRAKLEGDMPGLKAGHQVGLATVASTRMRFDQSGNLLG
jgi:multiple sugar transport system ATP-binding protein